MFDAGTVFAVAGQPITSRMQPYSSWAVREQVDGKYHLVKLTKAGRPAKVSAGAVEVFTLPVLARLVGEGRMDIVRMVTAAAG